MASTKTKLDRTVPIVQRKSKHKRKNSDSDFNLEDYASDDSTDEDMDQKEEAAVKPKKPKSRKPPKSAKLNNNKAPKTKAARGAKNAPKPKAARGTKGNPKKPTTTAAAKRKYKKLSKADASVL